MKKWVSVVATALFVFFSVPAHALMTSDYNKTIVRIGTQLGVGYIMLSPALTIGPSGTCLYDIIYISDLGSPAGKAFYATLLSAYLQGKPLSRVDYYNAGAGTVCYMSLVELQ